MYVRWGVLCLSQNNQPGRPSNPQALQKHKMHHQMDRQERGDRENEKNAIAYFALCWTCDAPLRAGHHRKKKTLAPLETKPVSSLVNQAYLFCRCHALIDTGHLHNGACVVMKDIRFFIEHIFPGMSQQGEKTQTEKKRSVFPCGSWWVYFYAENW